MWSEERFKRSKRIAVSEIHQQQQLCLPFVTKCDLSEDLSGREGTYRVRRSEIYFGARLFKALKVQ